MGKWVTLFMLFLGLLVATDTSAQSRKKKKEIPNGLSEDKMDNADKIASSAPMSAKQKKKQIPQPKSVNKKKSNKAPDRPDALSSKQKKKARLIKDKNGKS